MANDVQLAPEINRLFAEVRHLPLLMTVKEAAAVLGWSPRTYYERAIRGEAPSHMVGHRRFVRKSDFLKWLGVIPA